MRLHLYIVPRLWRVAMHWINWRTNRNKAEDCRREGHVILLADPFRSCTRCTYWEWM